jgi:tetratricopeptide (TPR) repeat protein
MKAGESIRINIRIQDARSGEILTTEKVEGLGESSIFTMVDDLTQRIKTNFEIPSLPEELQLDAVTTSSMEAYRYYVEGMQLHYRSKEQEAVPLLEKAVEADPGFAMALARLSAVHGNLGHPPLSDEYAQRAFEHIDRLPPRERYYVEGRYYGTKLETMGQSIETYENALIQYPDDLSAKGSLVSQLMELERFDEAIRHGEELIAREDPFAGTYVNLAENYSALGEFEKGHRALQHLLRQRPVSSAGHRWLAAHLIRWGKLDEAMEVLRKSESLEPGHLEVQWIRCRLSIWREDLDQAEVAATRMRSSQDPFWIALGAMSLAQTKLYRGRSQKAIRVLEDSIEALAESDTQRAWLHKSASATYLNRGDSSRALDHAEPALTADRGSLWELGALRSVGLAQAYLARWKDAEEAAEVLQTKAGQIPSTIGERTYHHLAGDMALIRRNIPLAIRELEQAQTMLPPRGGYYPTALYNPHALIWFSIGSAYLAADEHAKAEEWFQRITESTLERIWWPVPFVRSFYFLGKIHEDRGETEKACEYYRRFYEYWKDGDMDRERVEEAKRKCGLT